MPKAQRTMIMNCKHMSMIKHRSTMRFTAKSSTPCDELRSKARNATSKGERSATKMSSSAISVSQSPRRPWSGRKSQRLRLSSSWCVITATRFTTDSRGPSRGPRRAAIAARSSARGDFRGVLLASISLRCFSARASSVRWPSTPLPAVHSSVTTGTMSRATFFGDGRSGTVFPLRAPSSQAGMSSPADQSTQRSHTLSWKGWKRDV